jgi:hypothetical protein
MKDSLLNLISTPLPVLNSLGLRTRVGLSSDDPMTRRNHDETFQVYLSIYSPEGPLLDRVHLGELPANRRRFFDVSSVASSLVSGADHLTVVHRIPSRLLDQVSNLEDVVEVPDHFQYGMYRSMLEYSYPDGGNGSVIYETPPGLNAQAGTTNTLTFTCQIVLSEILSTHIVLIHSSVNPSYSNMAEFDFGFFSQSGEIVASDRRALGPFSVSVLDVGQIIPEDVIRRDRDPMDGQSSYTFVGSSDNGVVIPLFINASPELGAVALEHTHPPQAYMMPNKGSLRREIKTNAQRAWSSIFSSNRKVG